MLRNLYFNWLIIIIIYNKLKKYLVKKIWYKLDLVLLCIDPIIRIMTHIYFWPYIMILIDTKDRNIGLKPYSKKKKINIGFR